MWFGNTTILLMAGMMGIDPSLYEAAEVDGATSSQIFRRITLPLLRPILIYVMITSLIGGMQMFDVPQILTNGTGDPNAFHHDTDHVPEQASVQQELRHGRCTVRIPVCHHRASEPDRIPFQPDKKKTLPVLIAQLRSADFLKFDMGQVYVMIAFSIFPVIIVYILLSRFIVSGVVLGGVKG